MNLTVNVLANLAGFMSGMTQIRQVVQQTGASLQQGLMLPPASVNSLQTFRERAMQVAFAVGAITTGLGAMTAASLLAFSRQETAFAGILKTVEATDAEFAQLRQNLTDLSNRAPIPFNDLARIGELAGQLGIRGVDNLTKFTDTVAKISVTTTLTAEAAATAFARISNIMQEPIENVDRMGATVVDLGNKFATTESEIAEFALRIGGAGKIAGLTTANVFAIGTAFSSVGVRAEAGGTAIQRVLVEMTKAVATGDEKLRVFAGTAGFTAAEFQKLFRADPAEAFVKFIEGLGQAGEEAFTILEALTGEQQRVLRAMLGVANASDLIRRAIQTGNVAWQENLALIIESEKRFATFASTMQVLRNAMENLAASFGESLVPLLRPVIIGITTLVTAFQSLPGPLKTFLALVVGAGAVIGAIVVVIAGAVAAFTALAGAVGGTVVLLKIGVWVAAAIGALAALGTAVTAVVKFFGFFSETTNQLEARLEGQAGTVQASASVWRQFGTQVSEVWLGLKVVVGEALDNVLASARSVTAGVLATLAGWGGEVASVWRGIWTGIKDTFLGLWALIPAEIMTGVATILRLLNPLAGIIESVGNAWAYLRGRGQEALDAERQRQRDLDNELKREIARGNSMKEATERTFKAAGLSVEEFDKKLRASQLAYQQVAQGFEISAAVIQLAVTGGILSETEAFEASLEVLDERERRLRQQFSAEMALAAGMGKWAKERQEKEDEAVKRFQSGQHTITLARLGVIRDITAADVKFNTEAIERWIKEAEVAAKAALKIQDDRLALNEQLRAFGQTDFERFVAQEQAKADAAIKARVELGGTMEEIGADIAKQMELLDRRITERLLEKLPEAERQYRGLAASVGLTGEAAFKAQQAFVLHNKSYAELDDIQRRNVDTNAKALAQLDELTKKMQALALVRAALVTGYGKEITLTQALNAASIKLREQQLASVLDYYKTVNNAAENELRVQAEIDQEIALGKKDLYGFLTATTRKWVADQENIWRSFGKLVTGVFDQMQRSLSDVFFNLFTGQTVKLKDVWKSMLDAMLRELANFLATQTVRTFLQIIGNVVQGKPAGEGVLGGIFSGTTPSSGTGSGAATTSGLLVSGLGGLISGIGSLFGGSSAPASGYDYGNVAYDYSSSFDVFGSPTFDYGGTQTGGYYLAAGGTVPGSGTGDTVPAMLTPGEFVVRREVAQGLEPFLSALNRGGAPVDRSGRLYFQSGGMVVPSISGDQAVINLLYELLRQQTLATQATVATATNTGATAEALGQQAATTPTTANVTTISGVGGNVQAGTAPAGSRTGGGGGGGLSQSTVDLANLLGALRGGISGLGGLAGGSLGKSFGLAPSTGQGLLGGAQALSGLLGLTQGILVDQPVLAAAGGLQALSGATKLVAASEILQSTFGLTAAEASTVLNYTGGTLNLAGGGLQIYQGVSAENPYQITAGGLQALSGAVQLAQAAGLISGTAGTIAGGVLGGLGGGLSLYQGIEQGNVLQSLTGAYGLYAGAATVVNALAGSTVLPTIGTAFGALTGTSVSAGLAAAQAAGTLGAGVAAGGTVAATAGSGAAFAALGAGATAGIVVAPLLIAYLGITISEMIEAEAAMRRQRAQMQRFERGLPTIFQDIAGAAEQGAAGLTPQASDAQLLAIYNTILTTARNWEGGPATGNPLAPGFPAMIGEVGDEGRGIMEQFAPYLAALSLSQLRAQDLLVQRGLSVPGELITPATAAMILGGGFSAYDPESGSYLGQPNFLSTNPWIIENLIRPSAEEYNRQLAAYNQAVAQAQAAFGPDWLSAIATAENPTGGPPDPRNIRVWSDTALAAFAAITPGTVETSVRDLLGLPPLTYGGIQVGVEQYGALGIPSFGTSTLAPPPPAPILPSAAPVYGTPILGTVDEGGQQGIIGWEGGPAMTAVSQLAGTVYGTPIYGTIDEGGQQGIVGWEGGPPPPGWQYGMGTWSSFSAGSGPGDVGAADATDASYQHGGWVPGRSRGVDSVRALLEPGEFVVPRRAAMQYAPWLESLRTGQSEGLGGPPPSMPITINITVNGDVDDPEELAARLAPLLRDELRRIDVRYSRAGNKTQV